MSTPVNRIFLSLRRPRKTDSAHPARPRRSRGRAGKPARARRDAGRRPGGWTPPGGRHKAARGRPRLVHGRRVSDARRRRGWFYPSPGDGAAVGQGWAGLPIAARPRLVHGARPTARCAGRCRPPGQRRTVRQAGGELPRPSSAPAPAWVRQARWPAPLAADLGKRSAPAASAAGGVRGRRPWMEARKGRDPRSGARCVSTTARPGAARARPHAGVALLTRP